jgi:hypothetical protein
MTDIIKFPVPKQLTLSEKVKRWENKNKCKILMFKSSLTPELFNILSLKNRIRERKSKLNNSNNIKGLVATHIVVDDLI